MKSVVSGLVAFCVATVVAVLAGFAAGGLTAPLAWVSLGVGALAGVMAWFSLRELPTAEHVRGWVEWSVVGVFTLFALRSFCWLIFISGGDVSFTSPNNLGDLSIHITHIRYLANGAPFWPDNPIYSAGQLHYPFGVDLFNSLLTLAGVDLLRGLVWVGLLGALATGVMLWRWGGAFTVAGFLFNGGVAGLAIFATGQVIDYQDKVDWKSIPLALFVTQRGLLYAIPVGLALLWSWRARILKGERGLPVWIEVLLYATLPLFHLHTFLFLSFLLGAWLLLPFVNNARWKSGSFSSLLQSSGPTARPHTSLGQRPRTSAPEEFRAEGPHHRPEQGMERAFSPKSWWVIHLVRCPRLVWCRAFGAEARSDAAGMIWKIIGVGLAALLPATALVWLLTGGFHSGGAIHWKAGWMQEDANPFLYWFKNFGVLPICIVALLVWLWKRRKLPDIAAHAAVVVPAVLIFLVTCFVMFAQWEWDNTKLMIWCYLAVLPALWAALQDSGPWIRGGVCFALFFSGAVSLVGGLGESQTTYALANRAELDQLTVPLETIPVTATFACLPTYNHPVLLLGHKAVAGYEGHLSSHGIDYKARFDDLESLLRGEPGWHTRARKLGVDYLFWGTREQEKYGSATPWKETAPLVVAGKWGAIYDLRTVEK